MHACFCCAGLDSSILSFFVYNWDIFFRTTPNDRVGRTSLKQAILVSSGT